METLEETEILTTVSENYSVAEVYEQVFPAVAKFISSAGGSFDDSKDIFHDALVTITGASSVTRSREEGA